ALTREIAVEFARKNVRANALCPGPVNTPLLQTLLADPAARARRFVHLPMGRLAEAKEIAAAALFLASDESSYVNGTTFLVDGGTCGAYVTAESRRRSRRRTQIQTAASDRCAVLAGGATVGGPICRSDKCNRQWFDRRLLRSAQICAICGPLQR